MLKEAGAKRVIGKSSATIPLWHEGFSCIGFQQRKCLSSSWVNLCKALSRMESCLDQLFRWVILLLLMLVVLASYKFNQSNCLPWFCNIIRSIYWMYTWNFKFILSSESDWDWWARAVGGDKHNSSGIFFPIKLKQGGKSTKALPLSQEGRLEKCDKLRVIDVTPTFAEALRYIVSIVIVIMMATLTHLVAIGWDWTIQNTKYDVVVVPGASRRASASTMCFASTNSIDCPNNLGTRWKKATTISF